ncbi:bifunctional phosphopantothenoylcysteine decarboxylase/phosphopantothenate--cysteine ligase CoaBC [Arenimonas sp.]|uniref:bifunctional phosphopantothenoylcysteine decarboxylase/phosphopantothenate--cysteine ligase CoaBC n=1 Tax=Arenimonas sp. TaxID=1872635 RepID=UPI0037C10B9F
MASLDGKHLLLGVTGGIAAYKCAELVRGLRKAGAEVRVVMTAAAERFVTPTTLQALSGHPVRSSLWDEAAEAAMSHIELARWADIVLIAPASADALARFAGGHANDLLSTLCLSTEAPVHLAPAMNRVMWANAATQANVAALRARGFRIHGPGTGEQACGETGEGRMLEPAQLIEALADIPQAWRGRRLLITAGPTYEDLDPVRFLGNRSSGKMGFALAEAVAAQGAEVVLVAGPVALTTPSGVRRIDVRSAAHMHDAVMAELSGVDTFIAAAAVADYRPKTVSAVKIKKSDSDAALALERTQDILAAVSASPLRPKRVIGFAAETENLDEYAQEKMRNKGLDAIAANVVGLSDSGFESSHNALTVFTRSGRYAIPLTTKRQAADVLLDILQEHLP